MGKVHHIHGDEVVNDLGTNADCITCLEGLLERARNGDVVGVAIAVQHADGATSGAIAGFLYNARVIGELFLKIARLSNG